MKTKQVPFSMKRKVSMTALALSPWTTRCCAWPLPMLKRCLTDRPGALIMMQSITLAQIPDLADISGESCTDTDLIATYLSKTKGWLIEDCIGQASFYRLDTRDEYYGSLTE